MLKDDFQRFLDAGGHGSEFNLYFHGLTSHQIAAMMAETASPKYTRAPKAEVMEDRVRYYFPQLHEETQPASPDDVNDLGRTETMYEGEPDRRQSGPDEVVSRFRPRYRKLTDAELSLVDQIKAKATELETLYDQVPNGRYKSLAFTELEASVMWAVKEITK